MPPNGLHYLRVVGLDEARERGKRLGVDKFFSGGRIPPVMVRAVFGFVTPFRHAVSYADQLA